MASLKAPLIALATTLVGAVGTLGFVALTGAAIAWVRFWSAQLPADQAVAAMPRAELVTVGAAALVLFIFTGLIAVLFVFLSDPQGRNVEGVRWTLITLAALEALVAIAIATDRGDGSRRPAVAMVIVVGAALVVFGAFLSQSTSNWSPNQPTGMPVPEGREGKGIRLTHIGEGRQRRRDLNRYGWCVVTAALIVAVAAPPLVMGEASDGPELLGAVLAVAPLLAVANFGIAKATGERFWGVGPAVFFSVLIFGAILAGVRAVQTPFMQPAALIRKGDLQQEGIVGLYVTETSDRVWLAVVCQRKPNPKKEQAESKSGQQADSKKAEKAEQAKRILHVEPNSGRIFWVARPDVVAMSLGPFQRLHKAQEYAPELLKSLIALRLPEAPGQSDAADSTAGKTASADSGGAGATEPGSKTTANGVERDREPRDIGAEPAVRMADECKHETADSAANKSPKVVVNIRRLAGEPRLYVLDGTRSSDPGGTIGSYRWTLPNGKQRSQAVITFLMPRRQTKPVDIRLDVADEKGKVGHATVHLLPPIAARALFDKDRATLRPDGKTKLRTTQATFRDPKRLIFVQVEGHTDSTGSEAHNRQLSERRAAAVEQFLKREFKLRGTPIRSRGFGERLPLATNETETGRQRNRRVEVLVVRRSG